MITIKLSQQQAERQLSALHCDNSALRIHYPGHEIKVEIESNYTRDKIKLIRFLRDAVEASKVDIQAYHLDNPQKEGKPSLAWSKQYVESWFGIP